MAVLVCRSPARQTDPTTLAIASSWNCWLASNLISTDIGQTVFTVIPRFRAFVTAFAFTASAPAKPSSKKPIWLPKVRLAMHQVGAKLGTMKNGPIQNRPLTLGAKGGLEPPRFYPPDPKSGASANSATFAGGKSGRQRRTSSIREIQRCPHCSE